MSSALHCSFCLKSQHEVEKLAAGPGVYICDECAAIASRIMSGSGSPPAKPWVPKLVARVRALLDSVRQRHWLRQVAGGQPA